MRLTSVLILSFFIHLSLIGVLLRTQLRAPLVNKQEIQVALMETPQNQNQLKLENVGMKSGQIDEQKNGNLSKSKLENLIQQDVKKQKYKQHNSN